MENLFPPRELVMKCNLLIEKTHRECGYDNLPKRIVTRENMIVLASTPNMLEIMKGARGTFQIRLLCWIIAIIIVAIAWKVSLWILLSLPLVIIIERILAKSEKKSFTFLAAILLSLEMLVNDFAGWGKAYPEDREKALIILGNNRTSPQSNWLDYYLPRRSNLIPSQLLAFGPDHEAAGGKEY